MRLDLCLRLLGHWVFVVVLVGRANGHGLFTQLVVLLSLPLGHLRLLPVRHSLAEQGCGLREGLWLCNLAVSFLGRPGANNFAPRRVFSK